MSDIKGLLKNPRIIIFILAILGCYSFIHPSYTPGEGVTTNLNFGLDLEGGSWLQIKLGGSTCSGRCRSRKDWSAQLSSL